MKTTGNEFREILLAMVAKILRAEEKCTSKRYVIFEDQVELSAPPGTQLSGEGEYVFLLPLAFCSKEKASLEEKFPRSTFLSQIEAENLDLKEEDISIYPKASRTFLAKAALGIADTFATKWFARIMAQGAKAQILVSGCEPFTGKEPVAYKEMVLNYLRTLASYGVELVTKEEKSNTRKKLEEEKGKDIDLVARKSRTLDLSKEKILTRAELAAYVTCAEGTQIYLAPNCIVTAEALEFAEKRKLKLIGTD